MLIKKIKYEISKNIFPNTGEWVKTWPGYFGYPAMKKCYSDEKWVSMEESKELCHSKGNITLGEFQETCLLNILNDIKNKHVTMIELGSGWGRLCLSLAGAVDNKVFPMVPETYSCIAVEAEPVHYQWNIEHFNTFNLKGEVLFGAVSNKSGYCRFNVGKSPDSHYGQTVFNVEGKGLKSVLKKIYSGFKSKTIKVPMFTVDDILTKYNLERVDILQMDIQGFEDYAIEGAFNSIMNKLIDYIFIGTHKISNKNLNMIIKEKLTSNYDIILDIQPRVLGEVDGFPPIEMHDGILLAKRKGLE